MLDTLACVKLIQQYASEYQSIYAKQLALARALWQQEQQHQPVYTASQSLKSYDVCGIDGSQIYPDRHEGFSEYLINIGSAFFTYNNTSSAQLCNKPYVFSGYEKGNNGLVTPEWVNAQRTDYELRTAVEIVGCAPKQLIMFDGALMFWHLQNRVMQEEFLRSYLKSLQSLYHHNSIYIGYISSSHSRDLLSLIERDGAFNCLVDTDIMSFFLKPGQYTAIFKSRSILSDVYPPEMRPSFFYLHVGYEVARIELPEYCAENKEVVDYVIAIVLDQVEKGFGYPVVLSEAHEQAVIKAADRDFFYTMLCMYHNKTDTASLKLSKKRSAAI